MCVTHWALLILYITVQAWCDKPEQGCSESSGTWKQMTAENHSTALFWKGDAQTNINNSNDDATIVVEWWWWSFFPLPPLPSVLKHWYEITRHSAGILLHLRSHTQISKVNDIPSFPIMMSYPHIPKHPHPSLSPSRSVWLTVCSQ